MSEAARRSGLGTETIRFYERCGLLDRVARDRSGHRAFSPRDLRVPVLFERLRATGMPLAKMQDYAALARQGAETLQRRRDMLADHRAQLAVQQHRIDRGR